MNEYKLRPIKFLWQLLNKTISEAKVYILGYRSYTALLTQVGTDPPTAIVLENNLGAVTYNYEGIGEYIITSSSLFTINKTVVFITSNGNGNYESNVVVRQYEDNTKFDILCYDLLNNNTISNGILNKTSIEIRVYNN